MSKHIKRISSSTDATEKRWRHRVAFTANVYLDIETGSAHTPDQDLERLAIEAVRLPYAAWPSSEASDPSSGTAIRQADS